VPRCESFAPIPYPATQTTTLHFIRHLPALCRMHYYYPLIHESMINEALLQVRMSSCLGCKHARLRIALFVGTKPKDRVLRSATSQLDLTIRPWLKPASCYLESVLPLLRHCCPVLVLCRMIVLRKYSRIQQLGRNSKERLGQRHTPATSSKSVRSQQVTRR
jgi:hypothetical protein